MKHSHFTPVKMLVTITIPIETETANLKEVPLITQTILHHFSESGIIGEIGADCRYYQTTDENKVVLDGDACEIEEVECFVDWPKAHVKVVRVEKKRKTSK